MNKSSILKGVFVFCLFLLTFITRAQEIGSFTIIGTGKFSSNKVYLMYYTFDDGTKIVDSTIVKNNKFLFKGQIEGPSYGGVVFGNNFEEASKNWSKPSNIWFTIFKGENKILFGDERPQVQGTNKGLEAEKTFKAIRAEKLVVYESPEFKADQAKGAQLMEQVKAMDAQMAEKYGRRENLDFRVLKDFIAKNPTDEYSLYKLKEYLNGVKSYELAYPLYTLLDDKLKFSSVGKKVGHLIETFKIKEGVVASPFSQADPNGKLISLSDFKGKYVLIDFWASWCVPCRAENPNVVKAYEKYKHKNFEILGISLDSKKENWLEAIAKDGLQWPQVSDLKGWKNEVSVLYGIRAIPANILIDPTGKIVAKDLKGEKLHEALEKILK